MRLALDATGVAAEAGPWRNHDAPLQAQRNGDAVCPLDAATGKVISLCQERDRHQEWLKFLHLLDEATPAGPELPIIAANYATQKKRQGAALAGEASAISHALHACQRFGAEYG